MTTRFPWASLKKILLKTRGDHRARGTMDRLADAEARLERRLVPKGWVRIGIPAFFLVLMTLLLVDSTFRRTTTVDEPDHLVRGLSYWWMGTARLSIAHPILSNAVAALPAALFFPREDFSKYSGWKTANQKRIRTKYFEKHYDDTARFQGNAARLMMAGLTLLMAFYIFTLCRRCFGWLTGTTALALLTLNPTLIANGRMMTTDLPLTFALVLLAGEFVHFIRTPGILPTVRIALVCAVAAMTKYTALPIVCIFPAAALYFVFKGSGRYRQTRRARRLGAYLLQMTGIAVIAVTAINAVYLFEDTFMSVDEILAAPEPDEPSVKLLDDKLLESTVLAHLPGGMRVPLPYTYVFSVFTVWKHSSSGHPTWFMGKRYRNGKPYYFPVLIAVKTPAVYWLCLILGAAALLMRPIRPTLFTASFGGFLILFMGLLISAKLNMGIRHALPAVPVLAILAARGFVRGLLVLTPARIGRPGYRIVRHSFYLVFAMALYGATVNYPDYLGYFNTAVGRKSGLRLSVMGEDGGQDIRDFAKWVKKRKIAPLYYTPIGISCSLELKRNGVKFRKTTCKSLREKGLSKPGYFALHAVSKNRYQCLPKKGKNHEVARFNDHIYVYFHDPKQRTHKKR